MQRHIRILGTRGIPGRHGGFETFAEDLALHLVERGWSVTVYCQEEGTGPIREDRWEGARLVRVPVRVGGGLGTIVFDWRCTRHAVQEDGLALVLGYNTALFSAAYRRRGIPNLLNMDGIEWRRQKYNLAERGWFYVNEWLGCLLADHLVADHPEIAARLAARTAARRVTTIPYGARTVEDADAAFLADLGLTPDGYALVVARPEPENSTLEIVRAFSAAPRTCKLVVLGHYRRDVAYERAVLESASGDVVFPGAVYDRPAIDALRYFARLYVHGHTVGGTNPALVEALGAGMPVLAHDNRFNRWVAGDAALYFADQSACAGQLDRLLSQTAAPQLGTMRQAARRRHATTFALADTLTEYERLLARWADGGTHVGAARRAVGATRATAVRHADAADQGMAPDRL